MALGESLIQGMGNLYGVGTANMRFGDGGKLAGPETAVARNMAVNIQNAYDGSVGESTAMQQASVASPDRLTAANNQLANLLGLGQGGMDQALATLQNSPGYQFALQQSNQALQKQMGAQGLGMSGNFGTALTNQTQQMAAANVYQQQIGGLGSYLKQQSDNAAQYAATQQARGSLAAGVQNQLGSALGYAAADF